MDVRPAAIEVLTIRKLHGSFEADVQIRSGSLGAIELTLKIVAMNFEEVPKRVSETLAAFAGELIGATANSK